ncbi:hypothetical protein BH24CHL4_BH24CHL4_11610 [soil metagenome]
MSIIRRSEASRAASTPQLIEGDLFARGMAVLRIFMGIIFLANGLAKVEPELGRIDVGWYHGNLITQNQSRQILDFEVNDRQVREGAPRGTQVPGVKWVANEVILEHWNIFKWLVTITELAVGALLILGLGTRLAALAGLLFQLFLAAVYFSSNRWMFEQPHEYVPLIILALVPAGRMWGLDRALVRRNRALMRWPF